MSIEHRIHIRIAGGAAALAAVLGITVITSTIVASRAYERKAQRELNRTSEIIVKGSARQRITSDLATWEVRLVGLGPDLPTAYTDLDRGAARLQEFLGWAGFSAPEIASSAITTTTFYRRRPDGAETREPESFELERTYTMTTTTVNKVVAAAGDVTVLLKDGVRIAASRPAYSYTALPDLRVSILGDASADARLRADEIASKTGAKITRVRAVQQGPIQLTEPNSTHVSSSGRYDTSTIEKDASVTVTITFGIEG